jgi:hypothetical protein
MEVQGQSFIAILQGMDVVQARALRMLAEQGISPPIESEGWYPMPVLLAALQSIIEQIGPATVKGIGRRVPSTAPFPRDIQTLEQALRSIDTAYHTTHRGRGHIGAYRYHAGPGPRSARIVSDTPYPCDLEMGLVESLADRFRPPDALGMRLEHGPSSCRKRGDKDCTYQLSW